MTLITKRVIDLTWEEYKACRRLCFRSTGFMFYNIEEALVTEQTYHSKRRFSRVFLITDGDDGNLMAWALLTPRKTKGYNAQFYTRSTLRNQGLGTKLMEAVRTVDPRPFVIPHDRTSGEFFKKSQKFVRVDSRGDLKYMR